MFWKKHKSKEEFKETQWYMLRWYTFRWSSLALGRIRFNSLVNLIHQCDLSVVSFVFCDDEVLMGSWDGFCFELFGTSKQHIKFTELCYMNEQLEFFTVEDSVLTRVLSFIFRRKNISYDEKKERSDFLWLLQKLKKKKS